MKKYQRRISILVVAVISLVGPIAPTISASASPWQMKYRSGWYKVRVKKATKVTKIKFGKGSYLNKAVGTKTLHKGAVVKVSFMGRNSFDWLIKSPHKYKWTSKYAYSAHFKKNSFTVIHHYK